MNKEEKINEYEAEHTHTLLKDKDKDYLTCLIYYLSGYTGISYEKLNEIIMSFNELNKILKKKEWIKNE